MVERKAERKRFFSDYISNFTESNLPTIFQQLCNESAVTDFDLSVEIVDDAAITVNWAYWDLIDHHARPIIENLDSDRANVEEEEDRVDIYKMLSCIEYAIIKISPYYILHDGTQVDYSNPDNIKFQHLENVMNGYLAFYGALEFLKRWAGKYSKVFSTESSIAALDRVEEIEHRFNAMTLLSEHVHVVVYSAKSSVIPLFSNACWWRLVCAFGAKNDTK